MESEEVPPQSLLQQAEARVSQSKQVRQLLLQRRVVAIGHGGAANMLVMCTGAESGRLMDTSVWASAQVPPAWQGAALRRALLPLNGLRTISTISVMVRHRAG